MGLRPVLSSFRAYRSCTARSYHFQHRPVRPRAPQQYIRLSGPGRRQPPSHQGRARRDREEGNLPADAYLRSTKAVKDDHIEAVDGSIGHVSGFIFNEVAWVMRYLTVDTRNWWQVGREVLMATQWIDFVDWVGSTVSTRLTREAIKNSLPTTHPFRSVAAMRRRFMNTMARTGIGRRTNLNASRPESGLA